jgi:DNA-binding NarL/FixJ family response regulator
LLTYKTAPAQAQAGLTVREVEVLRLLTDGHADKEIAEKLFISTRTASSHVAAIIGKLGVDSRTAAVAAAFRRGLV